MQEDLINLILCPKCHGDLSVYRRLQTSQISNFNFISYGLLVCKRCNTFYPVIDRIPRLLRDEELTMEEKEVIQKYIELPSSETEIIHESLVDAEKKYELIKKILKEKMKYEHITSPKLRERADREIQYRVYETEKKEKFIKTCVPHLNKPPKIIADIGGGQGGTISCFSRYFNPDKTILLDIDLTWVHIARIRDPLVNVIRANAANIPLKNESVDFSITTHSIEHIEQWKKATEEIARISKNSLVCYGPNKWFLYDPGHLDAPFVNVLPKPIGAYVAYVFHRMRRTGRSYKSIRNELNRTFYIPRYKMVLILKKFGSVKNVFPEFVYNSVSSDSHYFFSGIKSFLKSHKNILVFFAKLLVILGIEPYVYLFYKNKSIRANE